MDPKDQKIEELKQEVSHLKSSLSVALKIVQKNHPMINKVPVNKTNWEKGCPTRCWLLENGDTYIVQSSSTFKSQNDHLPYNLFKIVEGKEQSRWGSEKYYQKNAWITVKYPRKVICNYLRIKARTEYFKQCPYKFEIRGSNILAFIPGSFKVLRTYDKITYKSNEVKQFCFSNDEEFEYYSIFVLECKDNHVSICELNFGYIY